MTGRARSGGPTATIGESATEQDFQRVSFDEAAQYGDFEEWALAPDGTIYTRGEREAWEVRVHGPGGVRRQNR